MRVLILLLSQMGLTAPFQADKAFRELCSYDPMCNQLKERSGKFVRPSPEILAMVAKMKDEFYEVGELYDVDPRALVAAFLAENSLNLSMDDSVVDFLVKWGLAPKGKVLWHEFTIGWGQMHQSTIENELEDVAARIEKRKRRSSEEITKALMSPAGAMRYMAVVMHEAKRIYKKYGYEDLGPEHLVTIYNLGKPRELASHTRARGGEPRYNWFGFFYLLHQEDLEKALGWEERQLASKEPMVEEEEILAMEFNALEWKGKGVSLRQGPTYCINPNGGLGDYKEYHEVLFRKELPRVGSVRKGETLWPMASSVGCKLEDWTLLETSRGQVGWVPTKTFMKRTKPANYEACEIKPTTCAEDIESDFETTFLSKDGNSLFLKLHESPDELDWKRPLLQKDYTRGDGGAQAGSIDMNKLPILTDKQGKHLPKMVLNWKKRIVREINRDLRKRGEPPMKLSDWDTHAFNPYKEFFKSYCNYNSSHGKINYEPYSCLNETGCGKVVNGRKKVCRMDMQDFRKTLKEVRYGSGLDAKKVSQGISRMHGGKVFWEMVPLDEAGKPRAPSEAHQEKVKELLNDMKPCDLLIEHMERFPESAEYIKRIKKAYQTHPEHSELFRYNNAKNVGRNCAEAITLFEIPTELEFEVPTTCNYRVEYENPYLNVMGKGTFSRQGGTYNTNIQLSLDIVKTFFETDEQRDEFVLKELQNNLSEYSLKPPGQASASYYGGHVSSSYQPALALEQLDALLEHECVQRVFVPDPYLVMKHREREPDRVIQQKFFEDDRIRVELKRDCVE